MTKFIIKYGLVFCFFMVFHSVIGQNLSFDQFTTKDGLPSMKTYNIVQDKLGIIWIVTENGLVSYDGNEFTRHTHPDLIDNDMIQVSIDAAGRLYFINLSHQMGYLKNNEIVLIDDDLTPGNPTSLVSNGDKFFVLVIQNGKRKTFEILKSPKNDINFLATDIYYFSEKKDEYYIYQSKNEFLSSKDSTIFTNTKTKFCSSSKDSLYYFDNYRNNILLYKVDSIIHKHISDFKYEDLIKIKDDYFIIKSDGVIYYNSTINNFIPFFENIRVNLIFFDLENNAWISTANNGLYRISNLRDKLSKSKFNISEGINDIELDKYGNVYLGTLTGEVIINPFRNRKDVSIGSVFRPINFELSENEIIAYDVSSVSKINIKTLKHREFASYYFNHKKILVKDTTLYIGTSGSLIKTSQKEYFHYLYKGEKKKLIKLRVSDIYNQKDTDEIYVGTINGLYKSIRDTFKSIDNKVLRSLNISSITEGDNRSIWIGTRSKGVFNIRNDSILSHFSKENGFISNDVNHVVKHQNELLVSTVGGLFIVDLITKQVKIISEFNYLPTDNVLVCKKIDNNYWIGTPRGLTILSKDEVNNINIQRPLLTLKKLFVNGIETIFQPSMSYDHSTNNIQLNLQNISYKSGNDKYIKYRIPKIDSSWISTKESIIRLPSLKSGKYQIEAIGVNAIGTESLPLHLDFNIRLPWWETIWARLSGFIILLSIGYLIFRFRIRQEKQKRDYITQINDIKDQALQLQMNPHFIFNSLNAIQGFIGTDDEEMAMNYLARFARLIRLIFEHSKGNTITLEEELEFINLYLDLEKLRFKDKVNIEIIIDPEVEKVKDIINVPPLLIQPIIENSFKHGLFHKKGKGNLSIKYILHNEILEVIIQDDGIGRVESKKISQHNTEKQTSSGISTTLERINLLNFGKDKKLNEVLIEDLYDNDGNAGGTKTIMKLSF